MNNFKCFLLVCLIIILITGCKKEAQLADDTWYIVDDYAILMLSKATEEEAYKSLMIELKGNKESLEDAIITLESMNQNAGVKNAVGVGYLRLRNYDKAEENFREALSLAQSYEDKACILSNLSEVMLYKEDLDSAEEFVEEALELKVSDPLINLILESNLSVIQLPEEENYVQRISKIKKLIKREKNILGSSQFVSILNYKTLGNACYLDNNMKKFEYYMNRAIKLNYKTYKYTSVEACLYQTIALNLSYSSSSKDLNRALDNINKNIELLSKWQVKDHYDLLNSYEIRGNIYLNLYNEDKALEDYQHVLDQCSPYDDLAAVSYYNMAKAYEYSANNELIAGSYAKAYFIWKREGWVESNQEIEAALRQIYDRQNDGKENYDNWFNHQIEEAEQELVIKWKQ